MKHTFLSDGGQRIIDGYEEPVRLASGYVFTEGPVWSVNQDCLFFSNFTDNTVYSLKPGSKPVLFRRESGRAVGLFLRQDGNLDAAETASHAVTVMYPDHSEIIADNYRGSMLNSPNDVIIRSDGAVVFTDPYSVAMGGPRELDFNGFYLVPFVNGHYGDTILLDTMERPNGLVYSPDESILYVNDTNQNLIRAFRCGKDNTVSFVKVFAVLDPSYGNGVADGMKVDREGNVYVTGPGGIWVLDPSGKPLVILHFDEFVGNFCFGDTDGRSLYAATSTSVCRIRVKIPGILPHLEE